MAEYTISKIKLPNGDICNIKDTWRGIQDNLTSSTNTTESLSAKQGYLLANGSARDNTKVSKSGDRMTGDLIIGETSSDGTVISSGSFKIGAKNDNYGVMPFANNWNSLGASNLQWYRSYVVNYYGTNSHIANWASNNNIGTAASSSAASVKGLVNFYNECAAGDTQTKTALQASANSNITLTLPNTTGTLALTSSNITGNAANVTGIVAVDHGGTGKTNLRDSANALINALATGSDDLTANDYVITQYVGGGTTTTTYHRRPANKVINATLVKAALSTNSTHSNQFLRKDGTWQTPPYPVTSVAGNTGAITADTLRTSLGLSNAMHFLGVTTTNISTGTANTTATVTIGGSNITATAGDVVLYGSQEYVWGNSKWNLLGDESSYKVKQTAKSDPTASTTTSTTFIDTISQDANGVITATKKTLPSYVPTSVGVTAVTWDSTNKKLTRTINGSAADVVTISTIKTALSLVKGDVGLGNVDNTADADKTVKYANMLTGFSGRVVSMTWGNQTGSVITCLSSSSGGGWGFRDNNPASGQMSMTIDGTIYIKEGVVNIGDAVKSFSVSGKTVTYTTLWGNTGTFTTQDTDTDTKNTAGSTNSISKLYLIGATTQAESPTTNSYQYTYTNNGLLSALKLGLNLNGTEKAHLEWNDTDQSIDFIFN